MKKWTILMLIFLALGASTVQCFSSTSRGKIKPSDNYITRDYKVGSFGKLNLSVVADIHYTQSVDGSTTLQVHGPDNMVELIKVGVKNNTLTLSFTEKNVKPDLKIYISSPQLIDIKFSGVGSLVIEEKLETPSLNIYNQGVGNVTIKKLVCERLDLHTSGVGGCKIQGEADLVNLSAKGVGDIDASNLKAKQVVVRTGGVGNVSCYAIESLTATVSGVGNISYRGNPTEKNLKRSGMGTIKKK